MAPSSAREISWPRSLVGWLALLAPLAIGVTLLAPSNAFGRPLSDEEREGQRVVSAVRDGRDCGEVTRDEFVAAGEYAMGQTFSTARAHEAMDELMSEMMGKSAEEQMHEYLGHRATRCGGKDAPAGFAGMMGTMSAMGGPMGSSSDARQGMMGSSGIGRSEHDDDWDGAAVVMIALMGLLLALAGTALFRLRRRQQPDDGGPSAILARRYARGEIDSEEYEHRRRALGTEGGGS